MLFASSAFSQSSSKTADVFDLGGRSVRVPAPDQFTDTMINYPHIAGRLIASESPMNEVLTVHVTNDILPQLEKGDDPDLPFFTKVSVAKRLKSADIEAADFQLLVAEFEKQSPGSLQSVIKSTEKRADEGLSNYWGTKAELKFGETKMLGHFNKQSQAISSLFLMNLEIFNRKLTIVGSMSMVHINKRLLYVYVFRIPASDDDPTVVADLTKSWTAKIVAANSKP